MAKRLVKSPDKKLFGVAGGIGAYFDIDPTFVRVGSYMIFPPANCSYSFRRSSKSLRTDTICGGRSLVK